jgi:hypothetical protein
MIDALASVGVGWLDMTVLGYDGQKVRFYDGLPIHWAADELRRVLPPAARQRCSVIVRPIFRETALIQLDDLTSEMLERLRPVAFLGVETSPGNFQAWIALPAADKDDDFRHRLCAGTGADLGASGAVRIAGSINFKPKYAPNFPRVRLVHSAPGRITSRAELESLGVIAPPERVPAATGALSPADLDSMVVKFDFGPPKRKPRAWPRYDWCLKGAPVNSEGTGPDRSKADFTWCMRAIDWGWSVEETAERLSELSEKAQGRNDDYALKTARSAAEAVERNRRRAR